VSKLVDRVRSSALFGLAARFVVRRVVASFEDIANHSQEPAQGEPHLD
jgi:hypothetical protein